MNVPANIPPPHPIPKSPAKQPSRQIARAGKKSFHWIPSGIFVLLLAVLVADYRGWLVPVQDFLERPELTYGFGKYQLNLYVLLQGALVLTVIGWIAYWLARLADRRVARMQNIHPSSKTLIQKIIAICIYVLAGLMAINVLGVDLTSFSIVGGAIGIGLGFGLQKIASNFISGLILLFERSVKIGDLIEMEDGTLGYVRRNSARYTLVETTNMREIMIPNEQFIIDKVINWTLSNKRGRLDIGIGVSYHSDLDLARQILLDAARAHSAALADPQPQCQLRKFGLHAVEFTLLVWISDVTLGGNSVQSDIMFDIWTRFKAAGIEIPFAAPDSSLKPGPFHDR